jgi:hypothetical protein
MATKIDPGGSSPDRPRFLENVRVQGGSIISRPDFIGPGAFIPAITQYNLQITDDPEINPKNRVRLQIAAGNIPQWDPQFAAEFNSVGGTRLWWGSTPGMAWQPPPDGLGWVASPTTGAVFGYVDTDSHPVFNTVGRYDSDDNWPPVIEKFNTEIYIGDFGCLRKIFQVQPPAGQAPVNVLNTPADVIVLAFPGFRATAMIEFQGKLWLVLTDPSGATNGQIWSYDGFVANIEYTMAVSGTTGAAIAVYKNELIVTVAGFGSIIRRNAAGAFSTHTVGGFDSSPYLNSMAQYRDKLMIMDGVDKIYSWNGTALALEHTIAPVLNPDSGLVPVVAYAYCCAVLNDIFYYGWTDINSIIPVAASAGLIDYTVQPSPGQTIVLPSNMRPSMNYNYVYTFVASPFNTGDVKIGATADDTFTNLKDCINKTHPGGPQNMVGGDYLWPFTGGHALFIATINTGLNQITLTPSGIGDGANVILFGTATGVTFTNPAGGVGPRGQYICLGRLDDDNPLADKYDEFYVRNFFIYRYGSTELLPFTADGAITAMNQYRGRLWVAVAGVPNGQALMMTHSIQYAPYDGWFVCDDVASGNPDQTGYGTPIWGSYGPGNGNNDFTAGFFQLAYFRSI